MPVSPFKEGQAVESPSRDCVAAIAAAVILVGSSLAVASSQPAPQSAVAFTVGGVHSDPAQISVALNGEEQTVRDVQPLPPVGGSEGAVGPWRVVIYFDSPLMSTESFRRSISALGRQSETLTALGRVEIVLADPLPVIYSEPTTDGELLRESIDDLSHESVSLGELSWLRRRFLDNQQAGDSDLAATQALQRETELLERQRVAMLQWLDEPIEAEARLLLLVQDGFDLNPRSFYLEGAGDSFVEDPRIRPSHLETARTLASEGWTVAVLSLGPSQDLIEEPLVPLDVIAEVTGGSLIRTKKQLGESITELSKRSILIVETTVGGDLSGGELELRDAETGRRLVGPTWYEPEPSPTRTALRLSGPGLDRDRDPARRSAVIELLSPSGLAVSGPTRFRAIASHRRVDRVEFWLDDEMVVRDRRSPYSALIDLGPEPKPSSVRAVALDSSGNRLGDDTIVINRMQAPPEVSIVSITDLPDERRLEVEAAVEAGRLDPIRVDFYLNETLLRSLSSPPYRARLPYQTLEPRDYLRVVAIYPEGETAESVQMATGLDTLDEVDVNTIEILATVTSRHRDQLPELSRSDFVVRSDGDPVAIDHFSRSENLPLAMGLLLDTSDSMDEVMDKVGHAAESFFQQALGPQDVAFVVDFDTRPKLAREATGDTDDLVRSIRSLEARGNTALYDSIAFSLQQFDSDARRKALVVVTDGVDSTSQLLPRRCIEQAKQYGVPIYLIVIGDRPNSHLRRELLLTDAIAHQTGGRIFYLNNLDNLDKIYAQIGSELRSQYFFAVTTDRTLSPKELERIKVEVLRKDLSVRAVLASQHQDS